MDSWMQVALLIGVALEMKALDIIIRWIIAKTKQRMEVERQDPGLPKTEAGMSEEDDDAEKETERRCEVEDGEEKMSETLNDE